MTYTLIEQREQRGREQIIAQDDDGYRVLIQQGSINSTPTDQGEACWSNSLIVDILADDDFARLDQIINETMTTELDASLHGHGRDGRVLRDAASDIDQILHDCGELV